jgi:small subunit ribosomal protein S6
VRRYEGFFLFDNTVAHEWPAVEQEVRRLCDRIGGQLQVCLKYDERKLAYEIRGRKRGMYVLAYFDAQPERIVDLERDAGLSEMVLRLLVLRGDKVSDERIAELKAHPADAPLAPSGGDGRRGYHDEPRGRREPAFRPQQDAAAEQREAAAGVTAEGVATAGSAAAEPAADGPGPTPEAAGDSERET